MAANASMSLLGAAMNPPSGNSLLKFNVPNSLLARVNHLQQRIDLAKQSAASQSMTQMAAPFNVYVPYVSAPTSAGYQPFRFAAYGRRSS